MGYKRTFVRAVAANAAYRRDHSTKNRRWVFDKLWTERRVETVKKS